MNTQNLFLKRAALTLAFVLTTAASAFAQQYWSGNITLNSGYSTLDNIILRGNVTITVPSGTAAINGVISNEGGNWTLTKAGNGGLSINSVCTYTGNTIVNAGWLRLGEADRTGNLVQSGWTVTLNNNSTLVFGNNVSDITFGLTIAGNGRIEKYGAPKVTLTSNYNNYTGETNIYNGTLQIGNGTQGKLTGTSKVNLDQEVGSSKACIRFEPGENMIFDKMIQGVGSVEFKGSTTPDEKRLILTAYNFYTGMTTIEAGRLFIGNGTTGGIDGRITINAGGMLYFNHTNAYTYSSSISGAGSVVHTGSGTTTLNGINTYTGATIIYYGELVLGTYGKIENSNGVYLDNDNVKFTITGNKTIKKLGGNNTSGEVRLNSNTLTIGTTGQADGDSEYKGKITGSTGSKIIKCGTSTLTLSGTGSSYNYTDLQEGTVVFSNANNLGTNVLAFTGSAAKTLRWASGNTVDISNKFGTFGTGNITFDVGANNVTFATALPTGSYPITKAGAGALILIANGGNTGTTTVSAGTLLLGNNSANGMVNGPISVGSVGSLWFYHSGEKIFDKVISGAGSVIKAGSNTLKLTGANTYSGGTTISGGALWVGNGGTAGAIGTGNLSIMNGASVTFNRSDEYTYAGPIYDGGTIRKDGAGKTILTGNSGCTGSVEILAGTLQIGNGGTSGDIGSTSGITIANNAVLRFQKDGITTYSKVIGGTGGKVEIKTGANYNSYVNFTGANTYTGTTTIEEGSRLGIGENTATGSIAGNIINNGGLLNFKRTNSYSYNGVISGGGTVVHDGSGTTTLNGINTYTGYTVVDSGTLILGASGSIENSARLLLYDASKFQISSNKTIKNLGSTSDAAEIAIGANSTLTIGTAGGTDGEVYYKGKFTGAGNVTKTGNGQLTMDGDNSATGTLTLSQGMFMKFSKNWAGNFVKSANDGWLEIIGNVTIGGTLTLQGGDIYMDLTQSPVSKFLVTGGVTASGNNVLNITTGTVSNQVLIQAAHGIDNTNSFSVANIPGLTATLSANGTQLILNATVTDNTPPVPGPGVHGTMNMADGTASLSWVAATDNLTPQENLRYFVYQSLSNNISTVANCEANGTLLNSGGSLNLTSHEVTGLQIGTTYWFNVVVSDQAGNKAVYGVKSFSFIDNAPPVPGAGVNGTLIGTTASLTWDAATDNVTPQANLRYFVYQSLLNNISTVTSCERNGILLNAGGSLNLTAYQVTDLPAIGQTYYFNVVVSDESGNKAAYYRTWLVLGDIIPPTPGAGVNGTVSRNTAYLTWVAATDNVTPQPELRYRVYRSFNNNISTAADCELNGTLLTQGTYWNLTDFYAHVEIGITYYFNVVVSDRSDNNAAYNVVEITSNDDIVPPTPGLGVYGTMSGTTAYLTWEAATDNITPSGNLRYFVYQSCPYNLSTVDICETYGRLLNDGGTLNITSYQVSNLQCVFNVVVSDEAGNKAVYSAVHLLFPEDVEELKMEELRVYPNPTSGELRIEVAGQARNDNENVEIYDVCGRKISSHHLIPTSSHHLDVSQLQAGIYLLKVGNRTVKFVKE